MHHDLSHEAGAIGEKQGIEATRDPIVVELSQCQLPA
jgi:hypothetical protein